MRAAMQYTRLMVVFLAGMFFLEPASGLIPATVPTQIIIEFTEKPAARKIGVVGQRKATSGQRVSAAASASAAAAAEHTSFRAASTHIAFTTNHAYKHVCSIFLVCKQSTPLLHESLLYILMADAAKHETSVHLIYSEMLGYWFYASADSVFSSHLCNGLVSTYTDCSGGPNNESCAL